jgi:hypothetical protein
MARNEATSSKIQIGQVIRNAIVFNFKNDGNKSVNTDKLLELVAQLFALLKERRIDYMLVGGVAMLQYIEGRNTEDLDLIIALPSLAKLPEINIVSCDVNFARGQFDELQIDFLLTSNPLFEKVLRQRVVTQRFAEQDISTATVAGLILLKLYALPSLYRQGNFARVGLYENDIATLMQAYRPEIDSLLDELKAHMSDTDLISVREIVADLRQRIERFGKTSEPK